jgi:hypothetical protein
MWWDEGRLSVVRESHKSFAPERTETRLPLAKLLSVACLPFSDKVPLVVVCARASSLLSPSAIIYSPCI